MAHYAFLDQNNVVVNVIVGKDETEGDVDWEQHYGELAGLTCKRTSYNTYAGSHPTKDQFRKNYASVGFTYDAERDAFIPVKDFDSWVLNEATCRWEAPVPYPDDGLYYLWNESLVSWELNQAYYDSISENG